MTVVIDLTPVRDGTGPARLLDIVEGRSKQVFTAWLAAQSAAFRAGIETVAMDGFTGFKTAAAEAIPDATAVMDPFHVVALAGDAVDDRCRQKVRQHIHGHRGRTGDPLYGIRRVLRTGAELLTDRQHTRLTAVFTDDQHAQVQATWGIYQRIVGAYRNPDRTAGKAELQSVIAAIGRGVPTALTELITLCRTLKRRAADILAYFDRPGTSNGPTEAINGRLEHPPRHRLGLPQPDQLHHPSTTQHRRLQTPTTPSSAMSHLTVRQRRSRAVRPLELRPPPPEHMDDNSFLCQMAPGKPANTFATCSDVKKRAHIRIVSGAGAGARDTHGRPGLAPGRPGIGQPSPTTNPTPLRTGIFALVAGCGRYHAGRSGLARACRSWGVSRRTIGV